MSIEPSIHLLALGVGYVVIATACVLLATVLALLVIWYFPAKGCFARGQKLIGRLVTDDRFTGQNLNLLVGLQSRQKPRWFFGLMLLDSTHQPPRWPRIITKKST